jgi:hypothetical protein
MALQGDPVAMRLCMERIAPIRRDFPVAMGTLPVATPEDLKAASEAVLKKVTKGEMTIAEAQGFLELLNARRTMIQQPGNSTVEVLPDFNVIRERVPQDKEGEEKNAVEERNENANTKE